MKIENIMVKGELLFILQSKQQWINKVSGIITGKIRSAETLLWIDKNGNIFECGADFSAADEFATYPCKVYRLQNVAYRNCDYYNKVDVNNLTEKCDE